MRGYKCFIKVDNELQSITYGDIDIDYKIGIKYNLKDGILKPGVWGLHFYRELPDALKIYEIYHDIIKVMEVEAPEESEKIINGNKICSRTIKIIGPLSGVYAGANYSAWFNKEGRLHRKNAPAYAIKEKEKDQWSYYWYEMGMIHRNNKMPTSVTIGNRTSYTWRGDYQPQRNWAKKDETNPNFTILQIKKEDKSFDLDAYWFMDKKMIERISKKFLNISDMDYFMIHLMEIEPIKF